MPSKYGREYRRQRREREQSEMSPADQRALELMRELRPYTYGAALGEGPRAIAMRALMTAIDEMAGVITGDREYFFAKTHSLCFGDKGRNQR
jgi:hypothetical protein